MAGYQPKGYTRDEKTGGWIKDDRWAKQELTDQEVDEMVSGDPWGEYSSDDQD